MNTQKSLGFPHRARPVIALHMALDELLDGMLKAIGHRRSRLCSLTGRISALSSGAQSGAR
jgi:hypothetical protein